jgi:predicted small lipoprotein YifL
MRFKSLPSISQFRRDLLEKLENLEFAVPRPNRSLVSILLAGALAMAVGGCGRKGALDPPPGGYALDTNVTSTPVSSRGEAPVVPKVQEYDEDGRPIPPKGSKRRTPIDWLID